jgi:NitT/TauT family transport system ATP-binding protein
MSASSSSAQIVIRGVGKTFLAAPREVIALQAVDLSIPQGQFVCLLGPSGCGKSTLLNMIAGFMPPSSGAIAVDGAPVVRPGPDRGMVFQEYALFPWMTVRQNVAFGLSLRGTPRNETGRIVDGLLVKFGLTEFRDRFPKDLSGGMRQRVAIARVLALDSPIMLMDEPFGALDALTRRNLQDELLQIRAEYRKTVIFVTHSIEEAIYLGDRIVVLTYRPGTVKRDMTVGSGRPRDPASAEFNELKRDLTFLVMEEQERFSRNERRSEPPD